MRSRRWLVEEVDLDVEAGSSAVVSLACADADAQGQTLQVYWDYEPDRLILEGKAGAISPRRASTTLADSRPYPVRWR